LQQAGTVALTLDNDYYQVLSAEYACRRLLRHDRYLGFWR
jgi:hypothetical protein